MDSVTRFAIALVLFVLCSVNDISYGQLIVTPWDAELTENFVDCFLRYVGESGVFSATELSDLDSMSDILGTTMNKMARSDKSSKSKLQALNMAFASAVAEIAVSEGSGSIDQMTSAVTEALRTAFERTSGVVNTGFIGEIGELLQMYSQEKVVDAFTSALGPSETFSQEQISDLLPEMDMIWDGLQH